MKKTLAILLVLGFVLMALAGCGAKEPTGMVINDGVLMVGLDDSYPPMEYVDEKTGEQVGFDVDLAKAIGEELGLEVQLVSSAWDGIFAGLDALKYDVVMSSVSVTEERLETMTLSKPYLANGQVIVINPSDTSIQTPEDLKGKKVGVQFETTSDHACQKHLEKVKFDLTQYDTIDQAFLAMRSGNVDTIVVDMAVAIDYCAKYPELYKISSASLTNEPICVAMKKGNTELQEKINECIKKFQEDGTMKAISEKWLGADYTTNIDEELR